MKQNQNSTLTKDTIYINGRFLTQRITGVQTFALEMCRELITAGIPVAILIPAKATISAIEFEGFIERIGVFSGHLWEQFDLTLFIRKRSNAVLLNLCNTGPIIITNQIVTIHDLAFIRNHRWFNLFFAAWYRILVPQLVKRSKAVLTVSGSVKTELIHAFNLADDKVTVCGNKVSGILLNAVSAIPSNKKITPRNFFLMVGSDDPRKNFLFVENYFANANEVHLLVMVGAHHKNFATSVQWNNEKLIRLGYVSPGNLKWLYENAIGLINPSLYEGFGIPNLEAMAMGCMVICSDIPVFREICGDAALYFNPLSEKTLEDCIQTILKNKTLSETKTLLGKAIFTGFQNKDRTQTLLKVLSA